MSVFLRPSNEPSLDPGALSVPKESKGLFSDFINNPAVIIVMFKVRQARATPPPPPRRARIRRTSSRRSGYAFSHAQGYGDLVTSGRFLRRPAVSRASGFPQVGRAATGFSPMGRSAGYSPTGRPQNLKVPDVEVTSLQMYRTFSDAAP